MMQKTKEPAIGITTLLEAHEQKDMLRLLTCGSVDDGKSTLIGRMLYDAKLVFDDHLSTAVSESKKYGTTNGELDMALLVDGLQSEKEQGITIDVAYRFFSTPGRKFIIADTPGHEQYTRNMVTGASTADLAIILIDAQKGILTQTRRHSFIVTLLGIEHIIVCINKMDLVDFSQARFEAICEAYEKEVLDTLPSSVTHRPAAIYIPVSALHGDNITKPSTRTPWYTGAPLLEQLETIDITQKPIKERFRFPVQYVNRPSSDFRGFGGTIASGSVKTGDRITLLPSGRTTTVARIIPPYTTDPATGGESPVTDIKEAFAPMAITLTTSDEIDIGRGDMIVHTDALPRMSNSLKVMLVWMSETPMEPETVYDVKRIGSVISGHIEHINYRIDVNTYRKEPVAKLHLNDIASCRMVLSQPVVADTYRHNRATGSFLLIDRISNDTVAAGMIVDVSRRESDLHQRDTRTYTDAERALNRYIRENFPEWECKKI
jgi:sulfate adenylyltransferase subunit 1